MYNNYDYPAGADNEMAPWNQTEYPEIEFTVTCSQSLSKTVEVTTNSYSIDSCVEPHNDICEKDIDTSDTNWEEVYHDNDLHTPIQLLALFKKFLEDELNNTHTISHSPSYLKRLSNECDGWIEDETDFCDE